MTSVLVLVDPTVPLHPSARRNIYLLAALRWVLIPETFLTCRQQFALMERLRAGTPEVRLTKIYFISGWPFGGS